MDNIDNPYTNQMPQQPMMPAPIPPRNNGVRGKVYGVRSMKNVLPKWVTQYSVVAYILALAIVSFMYSAYSLPWYYLVSGAVAVIVFFLYGSSLMEQTSVLKIRREKTFEQRIFWIAFGLRAGWMILIYTIFMQSYGNPFGFENLDPDYYDSLGQYVTGLISDGNFHFYDEIAKFSGNDDLSDMGYGIYVGFIYWITGSSGVAKATGGIGGEVLSIITVRLLKCVFSAMTVLLIYRLAKRSFGEQTARVAAIFCALWPNFWYYCGTHLKETEMVFLAVLFVEQADQMLRSRQFTAWKLVPILIIAATMFTFRTPLGVVAILALLFSVVMSSSRVVSWGKRIIVGILAVLLVGVIAGNRLAEKTRVLVESQSDQQRKGMNFYATRENGNSLAKYAGSAVFAPMIFTLPFPSMVRPFEGQEVQQLLNGGNFTKNVISGFTILAMVMLLLSGKWRDYLMPLSFMLGYLAVLALSSFAHSERFHQPAMPFEMMFAAYGLSVALEKKKYKRWFTYWTVLMFVAAIAWNWFKIKGRGVA